MLHTPIWSYKEGKEDGLQPSRLAIEAMYQMPMERRSRKGGHGSAAKKGIEHEHVAHVMGSVLPIRAK